VVQNPSVDLKFRRSSHIPLPSSVEAPSSVPPWLSGRRRLTLANQRREIESLPVSLRYLISPASKVSPVSAGISRYQQVSAGISRYQQVSAGISRHQQASAGISRYQQVSAGISRHQQASAGVSRCQQVSAGVSRCQQVSAGQQVRMKGVAQQALHAGNSLQTKNIPKPKELHGLGDSLGTALLGSYVQASEALCTRSSHKDRQG
jgi:hypothetical protein